MATRRAPARPSFSLTQFKEWVATYIRTKNRIKSLTTVLDDKEEGVHPLIKAAVEEHGETDDKGNIFLYFDEPISVDGKKYAGVKRERRTSQAFDEEVALALVKKKGLEKGVVQTVEVVDQDALRTLLFEKKITKTEYERCVHTSYNYATYPVEA